MHPQAQLNVYISLAVRLPGFYLYLCVSITLHLQLHEETLFRGAEKEHFVRIQQFGWS